MGEVREPAPGEVRHADPESDPDLPDFDDVSGLRACGDPGVLADLRALLRSELPAAHARINAAWSCANRIDAADALHRLLAGARYCGAERLLASIDRLERRARQQADPLADEAALATFNLACDRLLAHPA
jgi:hypothetical protein